MVVAEHPGRRRGQRRRRSTSRPPGLPISWVIDPGRQPDHDSLCRGATGVERVSRRATRWFMAVRACRSAIDDWSNAVIEYHRTSWKQAAPGPRRHCAPRLSREPPVVGPPHSFTSGSPAAYANRDPAGALRVDEPGIGSPWWTGKWIAGGADRDGDRPGCSATNP